MLGAGTLKICGIRARGDGDCGRHSQYRTGVNFTERGGEMIKRSDNSTSCTEYKESIERATFERQCVSDDKSWDGFSEEDKKMTFNEFILRYNEDAVEVTLPDGTKGICFP